LDNYLVLLVLDNHLVLLVFNDIIFLKIIKCYVFLNNLSFYICFFSFYKTPVLLVINPGLGSDKIDLT
jgi:hypothetical protein